MRHRELAHNDPANFCARVTLICLESDAVTPVSFLPMDGLFKKRKQLLQMLLWATLVQIFEQSQDVLVLKKAFPYALSREFEETRQTFLSYRRTGSIERAKPVKEHESKPATDNLRQMNLTRFGWARFGYFLLELLGDLSSNLTKSLNQLCSFGSI